VFIGKFCYISVFDGLVSENYRRSQGAGEIAHPPRVQDWQSCQSTKNRIDYCETGTRRHLRPIDAFSGLLVRQKWGSLRLLSPDPLAVEACGLYVYGL